AVTLRMQNFCGRTCVCGHSRKLLTPEDGRVRRRLFRTRCAVPDCWETVCYFAALIEAGLLAAWRKRGFAAAPWLNGTPLNGTPVGGEPARLPDARNLHPPIGSRRARLAGD